MQWSPQQDRALQAVGSWIRNPGSKRFFYLAGYAGTGKTTLAKYLIEEVEGLVLGGAFTGKAAHVLHTKGFPNCSTIHRMIYQPKEACRQKLRDLEAELAAAKVPNAEGQINLDLIGKLETAVLEEKRQLSRPMFSLNREGIASEAALIVLDECSMVDMVLGTDIMSFNVPVLALGDPAQLPPVFGAGYFTVHEPDMVLTEIHRQARDNPIIDLATRVRQGERLDIGNYGTSRVLGKDNIAPEYALSFEQILCGRNATRRNINHRCRALHGRFHTTLERDLPVANDRLVCLRNNHDLGILNGSVWTAQMDSMPADDPDQIHLVPVDDLGTEVPLTCWRNHFVRGADSIDTWTRKEAEEFDYGYALTVHKSQGSQYESVLVFDESWVFKSDRNKWLYTAITRASDRVTVVKM